MARLKGFIGLTSVDQALRHFFGQLRPLSLESETLPLKEALGRVLAEDVVSEVDSPPFDRSAVDGYAMVASDTFKASEFDPERLRLVRGDRIMPGQAMKIWTGSPMPEGADAVVMLEYVRERADGGIDVMLSVVPGADVSARGEDVKKGDVVTKRGRRLRPQDVGLLAALGLSRVEVVRRPRVATLSTGGELLEPGSRFERGKMIDVNSLILGGMISELGAVPVDLGISKDEAGEILDKISIGLDKADIVLTSGGTSVGKADLVPLAVNRLGKPGVVIHGISMRPGKPTGLAIVKNKPVILLPGNPVAAIVGFEVFVRPLILRMLGVDSEPRPIVQARLTRKVPSALGLRVFLRVWVYEEDGEYRAEPVRTSGASILTTITRANGYVIIPETREGLKEGEVVKVHLLGPVEG